MARTAKEAQVFTVRTASGSFVGTYRAQNAQQAVTRAVSELAATAATFRRSQPMPNVQGFTASVEPPPAW
jgi:hypothetical protein